MSSLTGSGDTPPGRSNLRLLAPALNVSAKLEPSAPPGNWSSLARQGVATPQLIRQINRSHHKCNSGRTARSPSLISTAFRCRAHGPSRTTALLKVSSIHSHRRHVLQFHHRLRRSVQCHVTMFIATVTTKSDAGLFLVVSVDGMAWFSRIYHPHGSPQHELGRLFHCRPSLKSLRYACQIFRYCPHQFILAPKKLRQVSFLLTCMYLGSLEQIITGRGACNASSVDLATFEKLDGASAIFHLPSNLASRR